MVYGKCIWICSIHEAYIMIYVRFSWIMLNDVDYGYDYVVYLNFSKCSCKCKIKLNV
jgi:hypothetical protein